MRGTAIGILASMILAPAVTRAQDVHSLRPGTHIRLLATRSADGQQLSATGKLQSVTADTVVVTRESDRARLAVAIADVNGLWIRRGGAGRAALKGAAVGAAVGVAGALLPEQEGEIGLGPETAPGLGLVGALIGAAVGSVRARPSWERVSLPQRQ